MPRLHTGLNHILYSSAFVIICYISSLIFSQELQEQAVTVSPWCELIHRRTYFILRVKKSMRIVQHYQSFFSSPPSAKSIPYERLIAETNHAGLREALHDMYTAHSLEPFIRFWNTIITDYHALEDQEMTHHFSRILCIMMASLASAYGDHSDRFLSNNTTLHDLMWSLSESEQLAYLCYFAACLTGKGNECLYQQQDDETEEKMLHVPTIHNGAYTESVTCQLYYYRRLAKTFALLKRCGKKCHHIDHALVQLTQQGYGVAPSFSHPTIIACIITMDATQSLDQFFSLWKQFKEYNFISDTLFLREFLILTLLVARVIQVSDIPGNEQQVRTISDFLLDLYEKVYGLPLEEILGTIDLLAQELPSMIELYKPNNELNWQEWAKKYCWAMPIDCIKVVIKVLLKFKNVLKPAIEPYEMHDPALVQQES